MRYAADARGERMALAELAVDLRRAPREGLIDALAGAVATIGDRVLVDDWAPLGESSIWHFNRLFWQRLADWERQSGRGFEAALPSGRSDANDPAAVADAVADFWTLLVELDKRGQLPAEIFALEIGVGSGTRAGLWLDRFKTIDEARATGLLSAASFPARRLFPADARPRAERGRRAPGRREHDRHRRAQSTARAVVPPLQDSLRPPDQRLRQPARRRARPARRPALPRRDARVPAGDGGAHDRRGPRCRAAQLRPTIARLLETGPDLFGDRERGVRLLADRRGAASVSRSACASSRASPTCRCRRGFTSTISTICSRPRRPTSASTSRAARWRASSTPCRCCIRAAIYRCRTSSWPRWTSTARAFAVPASWTAPW